MPSRNRKKQGDRGAVQRPSEAESHGSANTNGGADLDSQDIPALDDARPWMPFVSSGHRPDTAYVGNVPRTFVDEMLGNSLWARGLDQPIRAAIANAISAQCVRWHIEYVEFRDHVNAYLTRMDRHRRQRRDHIDKHMTVLTHIDKHMTLLTAKLNTLKDTVFRLQDEIHQNARVNNLEAEICALNARVAELEGGISARVHRAQRNAALSRSPSCTSIFSVDGTRAMPSEYYDINAYCLTPPRDGYARGAQLEANP